MARRGFHSGSNNTVILFFFMDKKSLMCQDWINENGLFIWIWSEICKHLTIEFQEEDLRLGTKPRDLIRKWFKMIAQASRKVHPCVRHCRPSVACTSICLWETAHWSSNSHGPWEFWPCRGRASDQSHCTWDITRILRTHEIPSHKGCWRNCGSSAGVEKLSGDYHTCPPIFEGLSNGKGAEFLFSVISDVGLRRKWQ